MCFPPPLLIFLLDRQKSLQAISFHTTWGRSNDNGDGTLDGLMGQFKNRTFTSLRQLRWTNVGSLDELAILKHLLAANPDHLNHLEIGVSGGVCM